MANVNASDVFPAQSVVSIDDLGLITGDRAIDSNRLRSWQKTLWTSGVYYAPSNTLQVMSSGTMQIKINPGIINVDGEIDWYDDYGLHDIEPESSTDRYDLVVCRIDPNVSRTSYQYIRKSAANPSDLTRNADVWELALAKIRVRKNATSITQADIEDLRPYDEWCGTMHGTLPPPDFQSYYAQYESLWAARIIEITAQMEAQNDAWLQQMESWGNWFGQAVADPANYFQRNFDNPSIYQGNSKWETEIDKYTTMEEIRAGMSESGFLLASRETYSYKNVANVTYKYYDSITGDLINHYIEHREEISKNKYRNWVEVIV